MSLNSYDSAQRIGFDPQHPCCYYGFYVSTGGWSSEIHPWSRADDRSRWVQVIAQAMDPAELESAYDAEICAGLAALVALGRDHEPTDWDDFKYHFPRSHQAVKEVATNWED